MTSAGQAATIESGQLRVGDSYQSFTEEGGSSTSSRLRSGETIETVREPSGARSANIYAAGVAQAAAGAPAVNVSPQYADLPQYMLRPGVQSTTTPQSEYQSAMARVRSNIGAPRELTGGESSLITAQTLLARGYDPKSAALAAKTLTGIEPSITLRDSSRRTVPTPPRGGLGIRDAFSRTNELAPMSFNVRTYETRATDLSAEWRGDVEQFGGVAPRKTITGAVKSQLSPIVSSIYYGVKNPVTYLWNKSGGLYTKYVTPIETKAGAGFAKVRDSKYDKLVALATLQPMFLLPSKKQANQMLAPIRGRQRDLLAETRDPTTSKIRKFTAGVGWWFGVAPNTAVRSAGAYSNALETKPFITIGKTTAFIYSYQQTLPKVVGIPLLIQRGATAADAFSATLPEYSTPGRRFLIASIVGAESPANLLGGKSFFKAQQAWTSATTYGQAFKQAANAIAKSGGIYEGAAQGYYLTQSGLIEGPPNPWLVGGGAAFGFVSSWTFGGAYGAASLKQATRFQKFLGPASLVGAYGLDFPGEIGGDALDEGGDLLRAFGRGTARRARVPTLSIANFVTPSRQRGRGLSINATPRSTTRRGVSVRSPFSVSLLEPTVVREPVRRGGLSISFAPVRSPSRTSTRAPARTPVPKPSANPFGNIPALTGSPVGIPLALPAMSLVNTPANTPANTPSETPSIVPTGGFPFFPLGLGGSGRGRRGRLWGSRRRFGYAASLRAAAFGIRAPKSMKRQRLFTGLEFRGL